MTDASAPTPDSARLQSVAHDLWQAGTDRRPSGPPSVVLGDDLDAAYQVQDLLTLRSLWAGATVRGHKVTSLDGLPCFGVLFDAMQRERNGPIGCGDLVAPRIQASVGFVVGEDLTGREIEQATAPAVVSATAVVLEVTDTRLGTGAATQVDFVADNAGAARFVIGPEADVPDLTQPWHGQLLHDGVVVADGDGIVRPWKAFAWLTRSLRERGLPLRAGEVVVVGGLTRPVPLVGGDWTARVAGVGDVAAGIDPGAAPWRHEHPNTRSSA